jgi:hypothetical protein
MSIDNDPAIREVIDHIMTEGHADPEIVRLCQPCGSGAEFARYVSCLALAGYNSLRAWGIAKQRYGEEDRVTQLLRASVFPAGVSGRKA